MSAVLPAPPAAPTVATTYRTCPRSGLQFEARAERLMIANAVTAVVALLIGGLLAIGVVLTRWPAVHWLPADTFYMVLTAHGLDMLIYWMLFFEIAVLYFAASTLLRCRIATPRLAWLAYALMLAGAVINNIAVFRGDSSVMMTSYVPMMAHWSFYLGLIVNMFFREPSGEDTVAGQRVTGLSRTALVLTIAGTLVVGFIPELIMRAMGVGQ